MLNLGDSPPPYHGRRFDIRAGLEKLPLMDGDVFFRSSRAKGPLGLPFSRLVAFFSGSPFTHSAIVINRCDGPCVVEVNSSGTVEYRLVDWLDTLVDRHFCVYRLKSWTPAIAAKLAAATDDVVQADPDYDFNFDDPSRTYCTRCVCGIYEAAGVKLMEPQPMREILPPVKYAFLRFGNAAYKRLTGCGMDLDRTFYWVGDERSGMMSSPLIERIYSLSS